MTCATMIDAFRVIKAFDRFCTQVIEKRGQVIPNHRCDATKAEGAGIIKDDTSKQWQKKVLTDGGPLKPRIPCDRPHSRMRNAVDQPKY